MPSFSRGRRQLSVSATVKLTARGESPLTYNIQCDVDRPSTLPSRGDHAVMLSVGLMTSLRVEYSNAFSD